MPPFEVERSVQELVQSGELTIPDSLDLLAQQGLFELSRGTILEQNQGQWVGFVRGTMLVGGCEGELFDRAQETAPDSMLYFEYVAAPEEV